MKARQKIEVTDEMLLEAVTSGSTFSSEYWRSLTQEQRDTFDENRRSRLEQLFEAVKRNETHVGIHDLMNEYRALRIRRIAGREKEIRDLYFAIPEAESRVRAINDLVLLDTYRHNYFLSAKVLEAYYRYEELRESDGEPLRHLGRGLLLSLAVLVISYLSGHLAAGLVTSGFVCIYCLMGSILAATERNRMASDAFLEWEAQKHIAFPYPIRDTGPYEGVDYNSFVHLFSEREKKTGEIDPNFEYGRDPYEWLKS